MSALVVRAPIALLLAMLPRRYWTPFEPGFPVWRMAPAAAILTMLAGAAKARTYAIASFMARRSACRTRRSSSSRRG